MPGSRTPFRPWRGVAAHEGTAPACCSSSTAFRLSRNSASLLWPSFAGHAYAPKGNKMALSPKLYSVDLALICPHCDHVLIKPGRWFKAAKRFKCEACKHEIRLNYSDKLALFQEYLKT